ncbi:DHH family phosphoesterase [Serratia marcescens]|nr:DHH family phosphoesterase [Serratia marcescens]
MNEISRLTLFPSQPDLTVREKPLYVFGHKNPDSDSICSALVVADWLNHLGKPAVAFRLGELTPETRYILATAGVQAPALLKGDLRDRKVWLVDFTDIEQGPASLPDSDVVGVIDHHRLGTLVTRNPPDVWVRAVGCCATVILQILTAEKPMPLNAAQATLLLGAILSDTVALSAPTTTEQDRLAVTRLRAISLTSTMTLSSPGCWPPKPISPGNPPRSCCSATPRITASIPFRAAAVADRSAGHERHRSAVARTATGA